MANIVTKNLDRLRRYAGLLRRMAGQMDEVARMNAHMSQKLEELHQRINGIEGAPPRVSAPLPASQSPEAPDMAASVIPIPNFWEPNFWEPTVQIAIRDYCRPGNVVFDVGANAGALSAVMSRHVGPRGIVCAFEASPRIINITKSNLVEAGCHNVSLYYRAVYHTSGEHVTLFPGTHLNDSIYNDLGAENGARYEVETLALDDFIAATGLMPSFVKMDIEGAEFDALNGASRMLSEGKPTLALEQSPSDMRCHELLTAAGYIAIDLGDYRRIESAADFEPGVGVSNILFVHRDRAAGDPYVNAGAPVEVANLAPTQFTREANGSVRLKSRISLPPGRYVCKAHFTAEGKDNEIFAGIDSDRDRLVRYHTFTQFMANSYRDWVFGLREDTEITPYIEFLRGEDTSLKWSGVTIYRYPGFDSVRGPIVY